MIQKTVLTLIATLALGTLVPGPGLFGQNEQPTQEQAEDYQISRILGDQFIAIDLGVGIPLGIYNPLDGSFTSENMSAGIAGSFNWAGFLDNRNALGVEVSGTVINTLNDDSHYLIPIGIKYHHFLRTFPFEFPLGISTGLYISRWKEFDALGWYLKPSVGFLWNFDPKWSLGINISYWWVPEFYADNVTIPPASHSRQGNYLEVSASLLYNY